jgi:transcriptional regulator with XRE-family HTH domain
MAKARITEEQEHARRVRAARAWAGMSQSDLATALGVALATVKRTEAAKRKVPADELIAIGEATKVPPWFILRGMEGQETDPETVVIERAAKRIAKATADHVRDRLQTVDDLTAKVDQANDGFAHLRDKIDSMLKALDSLKPDP